MRRALVTLLLCSTAVPSMALEVPQPGTVDPHIRQVAYNPMNRTQLIGEIDRETTVTFGANEQIARVVFGQSASAAGDIVWTGPDPKELDTQPLKNNLPLWPNKVDRTNLQVTTLLPDGTQRIYQFALSATKALPSGEDDPAAVFGLIFTYPAEAKLAAVATQRVRKEAAAATAANDRLAVDVFYGVRNWSYTARPNLLWRENGWPKPEVSDNGMLTAFRFEGNIPEPAVYIVTDAGKPADCLPGGTERLAPFSDKDDLKIIQSTNQHYRLRLGDAVMEVCNQNWGAIGQNPGTGTVSPAVVRTVVKEK